MKNKGITKFWIEIIGGVIIVVIILVIVIYAGSKVSTLIEDNAAVDAFNSFGQTMAKAAIGGTHVTSPWALSNSRGRSTYALVILTADLKSMIQSRKDLDTSSNYTLSQCENLEANDHCLCMLSVTYRDNCPTGVPPFNLISVDSSADYYIERNSIREWYSNFPINTMSQVKVLACQSAETFCTWVNPADGKTLPCFIHYQGKSMVWLSTKGTLNIEVLQMDKKLGDFFVDFKPRLATTSALLPAIFTYSSEICAVRNCPPCYGCFSGCSMHTKGDDWICSNDYNGGLSCD
jgi:hypothetical protein